MPTPPLNQADADRRRQTIEDCLREGYTPYGQSGGKGSSVQEAARRLGMADATLQSNVRFGLIKPDWSLFQLPEPELVLKGTSILTGPNGEIRGRWDKTKTRGMDPAVAHHMPDPKRLTKLSTLVDSEGRVVQQWMSEKPEDQAREQAWREFAEELAQDLPRAELLPAPEQHADDLLALYPIGDHHMGMLSWRAETGADYDLQIGKRLLVGAMSSLVKGAEDAGEAVVAFMGDFFHYDSYETVTPTNRNMLDSDGRFPKVAQAAVHLARTVIDLALQAHRRVVVYVVPGNHDPVSSVFMAMCLSIAYENEPRAMVVTSPNHYHYHRFGSVLLGLHHGHGTKMQNLPLIMAADRPEDWGETSHRFWWTGHIHQSKVQPATSAQDYSGCVVESVRILPPADAWGQQKGYRPHRGMQVVVYDRKTGEFSRKKVNPQMLEAA